MIEGEGIDKVTLEDDCNECIIESREVLYPLRNRCSYHQNNSFGFSTVR